ncbi:type I restriction-modification system subunit M, partial [Streptomyces niveiscabiei]
MSREVPAEEFGDVLWSAVDRLRGAVDTAQYKELVLGLVFLRHLSDAFEARREELLQELTGDWNPDDGLDDLLETPAEYTGERVFWLPETARWSWIAANAWRDRAGEVLDAAMEAVMQANPSLAGVLPKFFGRADIDSQLAALIDLFHRSSPASAWHGWHDVYAHLLDFFARAEGRRGGEFHTPPTVAQLIVTMLEPRQGRVYDPVCGAAGLLVQATAPRNLRRISVYGQEHNERTWRLARMNLLVHGIDADLSDRWADTLAADRHPGLKADFVLAHPPFNVSDWPRDVSDPRWVYGVPPAGNANYAWLQHVTSKLSPKGTAAVVLANGSLHSRNKAEAEIRRALVEADLVSCIVALPPQLFSSTSIPACVWILDKDKMSRRNQILFIDAHDMGKLVGKTERVLTDADIVSIARTYRAWRGSGRPYENEPEFCCSTPLEAVRDNDYALIPGLYVTPPPP